jgi:hypothetical protein
MMLAIIKLGFVSTYPLKHQQTNTHDHHVNYSSFQQIEEREREREREREPTPPLPKNKK